MNLTLMNQPVTSEEATPVGPTAGPASSGEETNVSTNTSVIAPELQETNQEAGGLAASGRAVNILGSVNGEGGGPFNPFSE